MQALILAGGRGERLKPLTNNRPKPMIELFGKPILYYQISNLKKQGIQDIVLSVGYLWKSVFYRFMNGSHLDVRIRYSVENEPLGTGGAIAAASSLLNGDSIVLNGDILGDFDFSKPSNGSILLRTVAVGNADRYGTVTSDPDGNITCFEEKKIGMGPKDINAGCYTLPLKFMRSIPRGVKLSLETDIFQNKTIDLPKMVSIKHNGFWMDIGTIEDYEKAKAEMHPNLKKFLVS